MIKKIKSENNFENMEGLSCDECDYMPSKKQGNVHKNFWKILKNLSIMVSYIHVICLIYMK